MDDSLHKRYLENGKLQRSNYHFMYLFKPYQNFLCLKLGSKDKDKNTTANNNHQSLAGSTTVCSLEVCSLIGN